MHPVIALVLQLQYYKNNEQSAVDEAVNEDIFRAYSIVSSPFDEVLEFFSIVIPDGAFTSQLQHLQVGDELLLNWKIKVEPEFH